MPRSELSVSCLECSSLSLSSETLRGKGNVSGLTNQRPRSTHPCNKQMEWRITRMLKVINKRVPQVLTEMLSQICDIYLER